MAHPIRFFILMLVLPATLFASELVTNRFGFSGKEIFPIEDGISHLRAVDLDGDGYLDLVVVNNARSRINLLYNQTGTSSEAQKRGRSTPRELNELPPDARFRIDSIASEKRIASLVAADLNDDGRPDLAYFGGDPRELVVHYNEGTGLWSLPRRWSIPDGLLTRQALAHGDLNGNGKVDLVLAGEQVLYCFYQNENGALNEPVRMPYSAPIQSLQVLDVQGDGRMDLLLVNPNNPYPFRVRFQSEEGSFGPEIHFNVPPVRAFLAEDLDGNGQVEVITIAQKSGRAQAAAFAQNDPEPLAGEWVTGQFEILPLGKTSKSRRGMAWADVSGDGLPDLLVAEPDSGQMVLHRQDGHGGFKSPRTFPSLVGISEMAVADWTGDGKQTIFVLSADERQLAVTHLDDQGRIRFPSPIPLEGRPLAFAVGELFEGKPLLAVIVENSGRREFHLHSPEGLVHKQLLEEAFKSNPGGLAVHDVNQDGRPDLVVLVPYERIKILLQEEDRSFTEINVAPPGGVTEQPWMTEADVDGDGRPELLLGQRNFIRAVTLERNSGAGWSLAVREQINGVAANSRITAATPLKNSQGGTALFLLDAEYRSLTLCTRDESGVWSVARNLPLPVSNFNRLEPVAFGPSQENAVGFLGTETAAWLRLDGPVWDFKELDGYESPLRDAQLHQVTAGDLNQDGRKDIVFLESGRSFIEVVAFDPPHQMVSANRWQVFEERTFRMRSLAAEPREALIAELTGDGKNDLAVIVHDRIIVYPQE